ncbi:phosphatase isoform X1 [Zea mays]|uniref:Haloacid dehalogenase-like hydrolase (HAD) superfamily protein n=1 Tax=Zea mays TaxID=4577 RepID=C0HDY6_MAIZE|nr:phosphatase isoform X1 [Zea mays]ACN25239.1 unknown [Zea mays]
MAATSPFDCVLLDLDDTLYPGDTGIGAALRRNIDEFLQAKLGVSADEAAATRAELFRAHGSSLAGLIALGYDVHPDEYHRSARKKKKKTAAESSAVHFVGNCRGFVNPLLLHFHLQLRARQATVRQDRARPAAGAAAAEHPAAQSAVHQLGPRAHGAGAGAAGRGRGRLRRRRVLRDHEPAPVRRRRWRPAPGRGAQTGGGRNRRRAARRWLQPTPDAVPGRQREEHRRGESARPPHRPGWQEGEEQGSGLRGGEHRRAPAGHPGDLGRGR